MEKIYFIDYSENEVLPRSGDKDLAEDYEKLMKEQNTEISIYDTKDDMMCDALEWASQAKDGCSGFEELDRDEMQELIDEVNEE